MLDKLARQIEALLLASDHVLSLERICELTGVHEDSALQAIERIRDSLTAGGHAIMVRKLGKGYRLGTDPDLGELVSGLFEDRRPGRLSRAALETLSVIAYSQPCTRADVEEIRGVNCDSSLGTLLERGMIQITGRKETPGRPLLYGTTSEFLEYFGLTDLDHLPRVGEITELLGMSPDEMRRRSMSVDHESEDGPTGG